MAKPDSFILFAIFLIFSFSTLLQLIYYLYFYLAVWIYKHSDPMQSNEPVTVIICARNEEENLKKFLPMVLNQDYPDFEVIVVNDCSEDGTYILLADLREKYPHLKISTIIKDPKFTHNKKFAQFIGIKAAKNEILVFTDADCQPQSDMWLKGLVSDFDNKTSFVLGYGGYFSEKVLLNKVIRCDTVFIAIQYLGMAIRGVPYMGVGRNLAYKKSVFFSNKGFGPYNQLASGDDDLFVNSNANKNNTKVEFREDTHTRSVPCTSFGEWMMQKKRHLTTAPYYKFRDKFLLGAEPASRLIFYGTLIALLVTLTLWQLVLGLFILRLIIQVTIFAKIHRKLNEPGLLAYSLIFDIFSPFIYGIVYLSNFRSKPEKNGWK